MCLQCPTQIPPMTDELKQCRGILQLLAASLFILILFALLCGEMFFILLMLLLGYILYLSWAQFNYSMTLNFFLLCIIQSIFVYVQFVGLIQYYDQISSQNALKTLFVITKFLYFPNAVFFSHYCYRHFKQYQLTHSNDQSMEGFQMMSMRSVPGNQPDYQNNSASRSNIPSSQRRVNDSPGFSPFQGRGISIG